MSLPENNRKDQWCQSRVVQLLLIAARKISVGIRGSNISRGNLENNVV